jgi:hypothetical protein
MTAAVIYRNPHPMRSAMPLLPMDAEQARFWSLFHSRRAASTKAQTTPDEAGRGKGYSA